jgi:hypothetical protein
VIFAQRFERSSPYLVARDSVKTVRLFLARIALLSDLLRWFVIAGAADALSVVAKVFSTYRLALEKLPR